MTSTASALRTGTNGRAWYICSRQVGLMGRQAQSAHRHVRTRHAVEIQCTHRGSGQELTCTFDALSLMRGTLPSEDAEQHWKAAPARGLAFRNPRAVWWVLSYPGLHSLHGIQCQCSLPSFCIRSYLRSPVTPRLTIVYHRAMAAFYGLNIETPCSLSRNIHFLIQIRLMSDRFSCSVAS